MICVLHHIFMLLYEFIAKCLPLQKKEENPHQLS